MPKKKTSRSSKDDSKFNVLKKARGKRSRSLREALRYSRRAITEKYASLGLMENTLQGWEEGRYGGLTDNGAQMLSEAYQSEGLDCRPEWLLYASGQDPLENVIIPPLAARQKRADSVSKEQQLAITEELCLFQSHQDNVVDAIINDDSMLPLLWPGDHVAGTRYFGADIQKAVSMPCIVQTEAGEILVRLVETGEQKDHYTLTCPNLKSTVKQPKLKDVKLFSAAPILWFRRK